jgi:succinyl-CoA synthetase alpha subunit
MHLVGEVEVVFGLWAVVLVAVIVAFYDWPTAVHYLDGGVNFTEALSPFFDIVKQNPIATEYALYAEFNGSVYPINPKAKAVCGVHCYASLRDIPGPVDLAVMILPSAAVLPSVQEAIEKGVKGLVVISAGFKEVGHEGAELEDKLRDMVRSAGVPLIGPNCLGVINTDPKVSMNAAFGRKMPKPGNLAFLSQSGALCTSVLDYAEERQMGFSKFISFGNKADVNEIDLLGYLAKDEKTQVIAMYLEDISDGRRFIETCSEIFWKTHKPMLCLKSGRSPEGAKAVSSHTGSLAGSDSVYDALLIQSGVQRVDTIAELFDNAALYCTQPLPQGNRVAIITNAGGPLQLVCDFNPLGDPNVLIAAYNGASLQGSTSVPGGGVVAVATPSGSGNPRVKSLWMVKSNPCTFEVEFDRVATVTTVSSQVYTATRVRFIALGQTIPIQQITTAQVAGKNARLVIARFFARAPAALEAAIPSALASVPRARPPSLPAAMAEPNTPTVAAGWNPRARSSG